MDKTQEALKLALEALEGVATWVEVRPKTHPWDTWQRVEPAITAIREALAEQPAQQEEPFGYITGVPEWGIHQSEITVKITRNAQPQYGFVNALYTSQPASKPKNVMRVKRISDQSVELVFTSCAAASEFIVAHGIKGEQK